MRFVSTDRLTSVPHSAHVNLSCATGLGNAVKFVPEHCGHFNEMSSVDVWVTRCRGVFPRNQSSSFMTIHIGRNAARLRCRARYVGMCQKNSPVKQAVPASMAQPTRTGVVREIAGRKRERCHQRDERGAALALGRPPSRGCVERSVNVVLMSNGDDQMESMGHLATGFTYAPPWRPEPQVLRQSIGCHRAGFPRQRRSDAA